MSIPPFYDVHGGSFEGGVNLLINGQVEVFRRPLGDDGEEGEAAGDFDPDQRADGEGFGYAAFEGITGAAGVFMEGQGDILGADKGVDFGAYGVVRDCLDESAIDIYSDQ
ncbi:unnamed protein product, partial [marine sediment metagenome]